MKEKKETNTIKDKEEKKLAKENLEISVNKVDIQKKEIENKLKKVETKIKVEQKPILLLIKSKYVCDLIFDYVEEKDTYQNYYLKLKLLYRSKTLQKKFNLNINNYQLKYYFKLDMPPHKYFYDPLCDGNKIEFQKKFEQDLKINNIDKNDYMLFLNNYFKYFHKNIKASSNSYFPIKITSPLISYISKTEYLVNFLVEVNISSEVKSDFISLFNNINSMNLNYPEIKFNFNSLDDINGIKVYKINFNKIKRLIVDINSFSESSSIFNNLVSFISTNKNLENLELRIFIKSKIDSNIFDIINNFNSLKYLSLSGFEFENNFIFKLYDLENLELSNCDNIIFDENKIYNIKSFKVTSCKISKPKIPLKFPKLEKLEKFEIDNNIKMNEFFDFSNLKNLKHIECQPSIFLELPVNSLEYLVFTKSDSSEETNEKIFKKLLYIKTLKTLYLQPIDNEELISKIKEKYLSINTLSFYNYSNKLEDFFNIQNKFPNLTHLIFTSNAVLSNNDNIEILENSNFKVKKISISFASNIRLYCHSYENIIELYLNVNEANNIRTIFPFRNDKIIFKSLKTFYFIWLKPFDENNIDILINLIERMPNLQNLILNLYMNSISRDLLNKLLKNILAKKAWNINLLINKANNFSIPIYLTREEIRKICPEIKLKEYTSIRISKLLVNL